MARVRGARWQAGRIDGIGRSWRRSFRRQSRMPERARSGSAQAYQKIRLRSSAARHRGSANRAVGKLAACFRQRGAGGSGVAPANTSGRAQKRWKLALKPSVLTPAMSPLQRYCAESVTYRWSLNVAPTETLGTNEVVSKCWSSEWMFPANSPARTYGT